MNLSIQPAMAPRTPIVIRDAEWMIRKADISSDLGYQLTCDGISELVQSKTGNSPTNLEEKIRVLNSSEKQLVECNSIGDKFIRLCIESLLRRAVPNDECIHVGYQAAIGMVHYHLDPALQALKKPGQQILIADSVGLGKTLEAVRKTLLEAING